MLPCPFPRELPLVRHSAKARSSRFPTGRPPVRVVTTRDPVPEPHRSAPLVRLGRGRPGSPKDATDESTFPWPHIAAKDFRSFATAIGRPVFWPTLPVRRSFEPTAPTHHTAARRHRRTAEPA